MKPCPLRYGRLVKRLRQVGAGIIYDGPEEGPAVFVFESEDRKGRPLGAMTTMEKRPEDAIVPLVEIQVLLKNSHLETDEFWNFEDPQVDADNEELESRDASESTSHAGIVRISPNGICGICGNPLPSNPSLPCPCQIPQA